MKKNATKMKLTLNRIFWENKYSYRKNENGQKVKFRRREELKKGE